MTNKYWPEMKDLLILYLYSELLWCQIKLSVIFRIFVNKWKKQNKKKQVLFIKNGEIKPFSKVLSDQIRSKISQAVPHSHCITKVLECEHTTNSFNFQQSLIEIRVNGNEYRDSKKFTFR